MRELGEYLKQMRKTQKMTLDEVADRIKVSKKYLKALEDGNHEALPPEVYVRGFIKAYGQLLGADIEDLYNRYEESKPKKSRLGFFQRKPPEKKSIIPKNTFIKKPNKEKPEETENEDFASHRPVQNGIDTGGLKGKHFIFAFVAIVVVVVVIGIIKTASSKPPKVEEPSNVASDNITTSNGGVAVETPLNPIDLSQEVIVEMGPIAPSWAINQADSLTLNVRVRKETWIRVERDYDKYTKTSVRPGHDVTFKAKDAFYLTIQSPDIYQLQINGFDVVNGDKLREVVGVPPQTQYMEVEINRSNVLRYLEGYKKIVMPTYAPLGQRVDTLNPADSIRQSQAQPRKVNRRPATTTKKPVAKKKTSTSTKAKPKPTTEDSNNAKPTLMPMGGGR